MNTPGSDTHRYTASCHCGSVELEFVLPDGLKELSRCNCSLCRRRGAIMVGVATNQITVTKGAEKLSCYQFHTRVAKHYFCSECGIYTHHQRRIDPNSSGVNVGCIDNLDLQQLGPIGTSDGANHPLDKTE